MGKEEERNAKKNCRREWLRLGRVRRRYNRVESVDCREEYVATKVTKRKFGRVESRAESLKKGKSGAKDFGSVFK